MSAASSFRFILILSTFHLANGQSQSSCLVQARFETDRSFVGDGATFSAQQQRCIQDYVTQVRTIWPSYDLLGRRFGGSGNASPDAPAPILGAGFGTTATRSLAVFGRQLGLNVHHFAPYDVPSPHWLEVDELLLQNCSFQHRLDAVNFSDLVFSSGSDLLLDTPLAELFLDFFAASPHSKVILTERDPEKWAKSRSESYFSSPMPMESPCGTSTGSLSVEDIAQLFVFHSQLVRCMVPAAQLLEMNVDALDSQRIAQFLGVTPAFYVPFPQVKSRTHDFFENDSLAVPKTELLATASGSGYELGDRLPVCITGHIRQLELQSKVERFLKPLMLEGHLLEVYLVLDPRPETSQGEHWVGTSEAQMGHFFSLNDTVQHFPRNMTTIFDPFVPERKGISDQEQKASHVRPQDALQRCWDLISSHGGSAPKMAVHLRDDMAFLQSGLLPLQKLQPGVHVPNCTSQLDAAIILGQGEVESFFNAKALDKVAFHRLQLPMLPVAFSASQAVGLCFEKSKQSESCLGAALWRRMGSGPPGPPESQVQYICENPGAPEPP